jgi:hypothetical protein
LHNGTLLIEGSVSGGLRFSHADGTEYGGPVCADVAAARAEVFLALRSFGFKESESKRALARVQDQTTDVPTLFRDAMRVLQPRGVGEPRVKYNAVAA